MADTKISALTAVVTPAATDEFAVNQGGTSKKQTRAQIHTLQVGESLTGENAAAPSIVDEVASATNPTLIPNKSDLNTGIGRAGADQLSLIAGGIQGCRINTVASGVNHLDITPSAAGAGVIIATDGADANIELAISPKGTGATIILSRLEMIGPTAGSVGGFPAGNMMVRGEGVTEFSNAVITGHSSFSGNTQLWYFGSISSSNDSIAFINRQNAEMSFWTNNSTVLVLKPVASGDNHLAVTPSAGGSPVLLGVEGAVANVGLRLVPKGTGNVHLPNADGPSLLNIAASATVPTLIPARSDPNTGIGHGGAADRVCFVTGGVEAVAYVESSSHVLVQNQINAGITASTTQTQGNGALLSSFNEVATVANANDTVTLPAAAAGRRCAIINNGANTLQIFPASGDDLGAGVDTAVTLVAGSRAMFIAWDATNWEQFI